MTETGQGRPLRSRLAWLLAIAGSVLLVCLVVIVVSFVQLARTRHSVVDRISPAALAARDLRVALVDQETGVRGYVLTRNPDFLGPYNDGREAERRSLDRLQQLAAEEPVIGDALGSAVAEVQRWHDGTAQRLIDGVERNDPSVTSEESLDNSRDRFDAVRTEIDHLDDALTHERDLRTAALFATNTRVGAAIGALAVALLAIGVVLFIALRRWVTDPLERLSSEVREVAGGDLDHKVTADADSVELTGLAADIDAMRQRIVNDLARLQTATEVLERQAEDLARSNGDLEQFAYVASHDLQEPLRKVAGFCQLLQRRYGGQLDERADEYIHYAVDGAQRMQQLINDLLAFSRVGRTTERFEDVDLAVAAQRALDNLTTAVDGSEAAVEIDDDLPTVSGDPRLLTALFQNLIANGIKFHRPGEPPRVEIRSETGDDEVEVVVRDNGIGIDPQYGEQIFTLFKRLHTKAEYEGTGIGLALCKRIVEFHGGRISLDAPNGSAGAAFRFTLPLNQPQELING